MQCPRCRSENRRDIKFCEECGAKLEFPCPNCRAVVPLGKKFCGECGHHLAEPGPAPAMDLSFEEKLEKLQRYLPDRLTERILAQRGKIEGERKQVTVMFCDAEDFSALSEKLGPETVYALMDEVFETLIRRVHEYGGTVNKMTGDGVMALFGAPIALEDAPQRAIRSALAIHREIARFSDRWTEEIENRPIRMRIGIHTGPVVVGSLGSDLRVEFTAVGDTVNMAQRMEGLAEPGTIYVTEDTFKLTEGLFRFEALGERQVKGKEAPVRAYRVIAPSTRRTRFDVSAERGLTPFLGRERELELLLEGLERTRGGRGQAFSIVGEAGVGKSRLLYEFRKAIANEDVIFLEGRCLSYSTDVAYHPVMDLLKSTFDIQEGDDDRRVTQRVKTGLKEMATDEASTLPFILELLSVRDSGIEALGLSPEARKDRTLDAVKRIVLKGSQTRPLVLAVEDLHWVDRSSEDTLRSLLDAVAGAQVLLVFTYRPEFVHTWGTKSYHGQVNLNRLSNRETLEMAAHILGAEGIGSDLEDLILAKTEGIPFFVEEFMRSLKDLHLIQWNHSGYYLAKDVREVAIPSTIQEVIMSRVDALPEGAKNVLQTGSAIGREFTHELVGKVTDVPEMDLVSHLAALRDSELVYERGVYPKSTYIFRHSLTQEVAYESLIVKRQREIHERIGTAVEQLYPERCEELSEVLAHHYSRSEDAEKAYNYLMVSAEKATRAYSQWEAFRLYRQAIEQLGRLPETEANRRRGLEVRLLMTVPMMGLGYPEGSLEILQEGEQLSKELGDERSLAGFHGNIGMYHTVRGDLLSGRECMESCLVRAQELGDVDLIAPIAFDLCSSYTASGERARVVELGLSVISLLERAGRKPDWFGRPFNVYSAVCAYCGSAMASLGEFREGEVLCEKALRFAEEIGDTYSRALAEFLFGVLYDIQGNGEKAAQHLEQCMRHQEKKEIVPLIGLAWLQLGRAHQLMGRLDEARKYLAQGLEIQRAAGLPLALSNYYQFMGAVNLDSGEAADALSCAEQAVKLARDNNEKLHEGSSEILLGRVLARMQPSDRDRAMDCILRGIATLEDLKAKPHASVGYYSLGELYADSGQKGKALEALKKAEAEFRDMGMDYYLRKTHEVLARMER